MFDIGFMELLLIGVILLLVVGPERLPRLAQFAGAWYGKAMRSFESAKQEINREIAAEELTRTLKKQSASEDVFDLVEATGNDLRELGGDIDNAIKTSAQDPNGSGDDGKNRERTADGRS